MRFEWKGRIEDSKNRSGGYWIEDDDSPLLMRIRIHAKTCPCQGLGSWIKSSRCERSKIKGLTDKISKGVFLVALKSGVDGSQDRTHSSLRPQLWHSPVPNSFK